MMPFDGLWNFSQPDETREQFVPLLGSDEAAADINYRAQLLTQIGRTYSLQGAFTDAHQLLDEVAPLLEQTTAETKARYLLERGRTHNSAGEKEPARALFLQAVAAAEEAVADSPTGDYYVVDALHMMGIVELPERQLEWSLKGLAYAENSTDARTQKWLGPLYNNIGWSYHDLGQYSEALAMFEKGVAFRYEGGGQPLRIAKWAVARTLRSLEQFAQAYEQQTALLYEYQQIDQASGYVYEEIAECGFALDMSATGRAYAYLAYEELAKDGWLVKHEGNRLERLKRLGE